MKLFTVFNCMTLLVLTAFACQDAPQQQEGGQDKNVQVKNTEEHRPQIHFSPPEKWMNDPNGMIYHNGVYHLFYQYYPDSTVWGPMHWGHATSTDMVRWKHEPVALSPDSLGMIFSGSAVIDKNNTSGFGRDGQAPLVAIFTQHNAAGEKAGRNDYQNQSLAYSVDNGKTWTKYAGNPVLRTPNIRDFRDPKVIWHEPTKKWIMVLAVVDRIHIYSSPNLKEWSKQSEFGDKAGAHGGVWECPDLFPLNDNGKQVWVLIVNINPGGPNKGSATQYFLGDFDGKNFKPYSTATKWLDYGPDEYAGVTWSNTGERKLFLGWMSNWDYAQVVPTVAWRSAMTVPRELRLARAGNELLIASEPVQELSAISGKPVVLNNILVNGDVNINEAKQLPARFNLKLDEAKDFAITFSNEQGEKLVVGYDKANNQYYIDRTKSGKTDFHKAFAGRYTGPRFTNNKKMDVTLVVDVSSVELFADEGLSVMTAIFFPNQPYDKVVISSGSNAVVKELEYVPMRSIWQ